MVVSIHALNEEGDLLSGFIGPGYVVFQSTPSMKRATYAKVVRFLSCRVSIHALNEEGDRFGVRSRDG